MFSVTAVLLFLASAASPQAQLTPQETLMRVEIDGLRNTRGQVHCSLFSSPADFPKKADQAIAPDTSAISQGKVCEFPGVAPGTYAISVFHDQNSNGKLDTNFMGMPREGVGASNNPKGGLGLPKFPRCQLSFFRIFQVDGWT
jgi:uncharacterized protein (DUF2141 family)